MTTHETLCDTLRPLRVETMSTPEVAAVCFEAVPDATPGQIIAALEQVGREHTDRARQLKLESRKRRAGITGIHGGGPEAA